MAAGEGYVTTDEGVRLFFRTVGGGPETVVLPNGMHLVGDFQSLARSRTVLFYDVRNRGLSDEIRDASKLKRGIHNDVDDLDDVRRYLGLDRMTVIGHSYMGLMVILYAMKYPEHVERIVQLAPIQPNAGRQYPAHLTGADAKFDEVVAQLGELQKERQSTDPAEFCRKFWSILRLIYVTDPNDAHRINWGRCDLPNEVRFMKYWNSNVYPSILDLELPAGQLTNVKTPVLTIHGTRDRSTPYGGGREWALLLGNARLVTVENAGHAPWIEAHERVFGSIDAFLNGAWPKAAEKISALDPR